MAIDDPQGIRSDCAGVEYVIMSFGGSRESLHRFAHEIMPAFSNEPVKVKNRPRVNGCS
jgi:hypothetical protein